MNVQSLVAKVWNFAHVLRDQGVAAEIYKTYLHCAAKIIRSEGGSITSYDGDRIMGIFIGDDHSIVCCQMQSKNQLCCARNRESRIEGIVHDVRMRVGDFERFPEMTLCLQLLLELIPGGLIEGISQDQESALVDQMVQRRIGELDLGPFQPVPNEIPQASTGYRGGSKIDQERKDVGPAGQE